MDEWIVKDSPRSGQAAEADFGELHYLNVARLKAGAHYTGITQKREFFLSEKSAEHPIVMGFAQTSAARYFAQARRCWSSRLNGSPLCTKPPAPTSPLSSQDSAHESAQCQPCQP
ncbi:MULTISPECIES: hypothetical protein [Pseudomonas]|uniref:hypothetical protein n=1 Tax=Pseudomonas TaxID=286 RepID=UPI00147528C5|nr:MULTISPECIES: hypothetical protein [Pseudomonas]MBP5098592.1 hypothetical protein [Pseudomonas protegens]MBP5121426.1 hypothetical protein [Pseudomonas protegens]MDS9875122.1 hypothetical protein [Pseudomonas protegens]